jgi:16S rRNA (cytosine1402-N4)-methyltransferase
LLAIDKDPEAIRSAEEQFGDDSRFTIRQGAFTMLSRLVTEQQLEGRINGLLLDLGVSSPQLGSAARGFGFLADGPLDMRMDPADGSSAAEWLETASEQAIIEVLRKYGEERFAKRIARAITTFRSVTPITTTRQLADLVAAAIPVHEKHKHPATRSFQAIRIFINRELEDLEAVLAQVADVLAPHGRLAIISFHSLEDRIVKRFIRREYRGEQPPVEFPLAGMDHKPRFRPLNKGVKPGEAEIKNNPRARSAVLRVAERLQ